MIYWVSEKPFTLSKMEYLKHFSMKYNKTFQIDSMVYSTEAKIQIVLLLIEHKSSTRATCQIQSQNSIKVR